MTLYFLVHKVGMYESQGSGEIKENQLKELSTKMIPYPEVGNNLHDRRRPAEFGDVLKVSLRPLILQEVGRQNSASSETTLS